MGLDRRRGDEGQKYAPLRVQPSLLNRNGLLNNKPKPNGFSRAATAPQRARSMGRFLAGRHRCLDLPTTKTLTLGIDLETGATTWRWTSFIEAEKFRWQWIARLRPTDSRFSAMSCCIRGRWPFCR